MLDIIYWSAGILVLDVIIVGCCEGRINQFGEHVGAGIAFVSVITLLVSAVGYLYE